MIGLKNSRYSIFLFLLSIFCFPAVSQVNKLIIMKGCVGTFIPQKSNLNRTLKGVYPGGHNVAEYNFINQGVIAELSLHFKFLPNLSAGPMFSYGKSKYYYDVFDEYKNFTFIEYGTEGTYGDYIYTKDKLYGYKDFNFFSYGIALQYELKPIHRWSLFIPAFLQLTKFSRQSFHVQSLNGFDFMSVNNSFSFMTIGLGLGLRYKIGNEFGIVPLEISTFHTRKDFGYFSGEGQKFVFKCGVTYTFFNKK